MDRRGAYIDIDRAVRAAGMIAARRVATVSRWGVRRIGRGRPSGKDIKTDCSVNAQIQGKTYCFGSQSALTQFMANPSGNLAKAQAYYSEKHPG